MKIHVTLEEAGKIVAEYLARERGIKVKPDSVSQLSRFEGQYDEQREFLTGLEFEIEEKS
jgi:hypothetical protein